jgi:phage-related baseplate assembly protein
VLTGNTVDLSQLPAPAAIESLDFETIVADMKADLIARATAQDAGLGSAVTLTLALESEPLTKLLEVCAYRELVIRADFNARWQQSMLAFAVGTNLDVAAANVDVQRLALVDSPRAYSTNPEDWEGDDALRARAAAASNELSVAGPVLAYQAVAKNASALVADVAVSSPTPGAVRVSILSTATDGVADGDLLALVTAALSPDEVRPFTDNVNVVSASIAAWNVVATLYCADGLDTDTIEAAATAAVLAYGAARRKQGRGVALDLVKGALGVPGVENMLVTSPAADIAAVAETAPVLGTVTLTMVVGEDGV